MESDITYTNIQHRHVTVFLTSFIYMHAHPLQHTPPTFPRTPGIMPGHIPRQTHAPKLTPQICQ